MADGRCLSKQSDNLERGTDAGTNEGVDGSSLVGVCLGSSGGV